MSKASDSSNAQDDESRQTQRLHRLKVVYSSTDDLLDTVEVANVGTADGLRNKMLYF